MGYTIVVEDAWRKRSHKHSYNAKSGIALIFEADTKNLATVRWFEK